MTAPIDNIIGNGVSKGDIVDFYIDRNGVIVDESATTTVTIGANTRVVLSIASIPTPNGDTLDDYNILFLEGQIRVNNIWGGNDFVMDSGFNGYGVKAHLAGAASIVTQTGSIRVGAGSNLSGNPFGSGSSTVSAQYRTHITAVKK